MTLNKVLEDLLDSRDIVHDRKGVRRMSKLEAQSQIEKDLISLIGDNEYGNIGYDGEEMVNETTEEMFYRNQLRAELRTAIKTYCKGNMK